jgi:DNA-binding MarR family transcriptional regulator
VAKDKFSGSLQKHVAHVLAGRGARSLGELCEVVGSDKSNLLGCLQRLEGDGLVVGVGTGDAAAPGQAAKLWSLTDAGRTALEPGHRWLWATFSGEQGIGVDDALEDGDLAAGALWVARTDGEGRGYLFSFDAAAGPQPAESLLRALTKLGARCTTGTVVSAQATSGFLSVLRTAKAAGERAEQAASADED